jgi:hypothetical protein
MIRGCVVDSYMSTDEPRRGPWPTTGQVGADARPGWRAPIWLAPLFGLAALLLLPWVALLAVALPSTHLAEHWDVAWAGFDVMLALLLLAVAITAWRRSPWLEGAATAAATLLFVDAWFDVLTSSTKAELVVAIVEALLVELPLAVVCLVVARSAEHRLRAQPIGLVRAQSDVGSAVAPDRSAA